MDNNYAPFQKIIRNGQVTIPAEMRKHLDLKDGDYVDFVLTKQGLLVRPLIITAKPKFSKEVLEDA